jgi:hypothetical protein
MKIGRKRSIFTQDQGIFVEALESRALLSSSVALSLHGEFIETTPTQTTSASQLSITESSTGTVTGTLATSGFRTYYVSGTLSDGQISFKVNKTATGSRVGEFTGSVRSSGELIGALTFDVGPTAYSGSLHLDSAATSVATTGNSSSSTATGTAPSATGTTTTGAATTTPNSGTTTTTTVTTTTGNTAIGTITGTTVVGETGTGGTGTGISDTGAGTGTGITDTGAGTGTGISDTNTGTGISDTSAGTGTGVSDGNESTGTTPITPPTTTTGTGTTTTGTDSTPTEPAAPGSGGILLRSFSETPIAFAD